MAEPLSNRPKLTVNDVSLGYISRYFIKHISMPKIIEIDKRQYDVFKFDSLYETLELKWMINGFANNTVAKDGKTIYGVKHQNEVTLNFVEQKIPGIKNFLRNPLEYFQGVYNRTEIISSVVPQTTTVEITPAPATSTPPAPNPEIPADYWWRADSGLTTSSWTSSNGGLDFTFTNVTTASSAVGVVFNGTNGFGQTPVLTSNISATHVLVRLDSLIISTDDALLGGTQNNIHEIAHNASGFWNIVDATNASVRYGARTTTNIISPMPKVLWFDFETGTNAVNVYTDDNSSIKASMARYTGTYNNLFTWLSGYSMYLGRRQQVSGAAGYMRVNVKELAIFTSSLSYAEVDAFRTEMLARWP
jgi:hypothetical protein